MPIQTAFRFSHRRSTELLLTSVSIAAMLVVAPGAGANPLANGNLPTPSAAAIAAAQSGQQEAARAARAAQNTLRRATLAVQAQQASQAAARSAAQLQLNALPNLVPNGLAGLKIGTGVTRPDGTIDAALWKGANLPTAFTDGDRVKVNIGQTQQKAILTWDTFNVGGKTDLTFDQQGNSSWVALNRVLGTDGRPSQILGSIKADGSVYVINQNGIIFGGTSQVNVGALIASTAAISNEQFLTSGLYSTQSGTSWIPSFTNAGGAVRVEAGAAITTTAPTSVTAGGGFVLLLGREVHNAGTITTPLGQTQLAAGNDFILRRGYGTDANSFSTTRGNEISPVVRDALAVVRNTGLIFAPQGDITLAGRTLLQDGVLLSTTSVNTRGTIHLLNAATDTLGSITLGAGSLTTVIPELLSTETALDSQREALIKASAAANGQRSATGAFNNLSTLADRLDQSRIEIVSGGDVVFAGGADGSITLAQGGQVAVSAGRRVFTADGSVIDVSGVRDVQLAMSANNLKINIQGNELRDSPQNRDNSYLKNADVWVDLRDLIYVPAGTGGYDSDRYYTPGGLLEVGGYLANTKHTIGEWSAVGGTITLAAPEVIAQAGSIFDISGGSLAYAGGNIQTTNFLGKDGRLYNVNDARGDMTFYGLGEGFVRSNDRWGVTQVWSSPFGKGRVTTRWEDGYTVGRDAGQLILSTPTAVFEGKILADVVQGSRQLNARPAGATDGYKVGQTQVAKAGQLLVGAYGALGRIGAYTSDVVIGDIANVTAGLDASSVLPSGRAGTLYLDAGHLNEQKLGGLDIATRGAIAIDSDLTLADGGSLDLVAPTVNINADVTARAGSVAVTNILRPDAAILTPIVLTAADGTAQLTLHAGATIDTRGLWTNAANAPGDLSGLAFINGGSVSFNSTQGATITVGSTIDVSSGAAVLPNGKTTGGKGGSVTLVADDRSVGGRSVGGRLVLDGRINGYGASGGGKLVIGSGPSIVIGGKALANDGVLGAGERAPIPLLLAEEIIIPAGGRIPFNYDETITGLAPGDFAPVPLKVDANQQKPLKVGPDGWTVPAGTNFYDVNYTYFGAGAHVAPGTLIFPGDGVKLPAGFTFTAGEFPNGIVVAETRVTFTAGDVASTQLRFAAGTTIPLGTVAPRPLAVAPLTELGTGLFQTGFSSYDINGHQGLLVQDRAVIDVNMPVYRFGAAAWSAPTGSDPASALELWLPPVTQDDPAKRQIAWRAGADLTLQSNLDLNKGALVIGRDANITVDPRRAITLQSPGQITVDGRLTAAGGRINVIQMNVASTSTSFANPTLGARSIWLGETAVLDVAGRGASALDRAGERYGFADAGGSIMLGAITGNEVGGIAYAGNSFVITRPGARLDASGTSIVIDVPSAGFGASGAAQPLTLATPGGTIGINTFSGFYLDGEMTAKAGGEGAAGGTLSLALVTPRYADPIDQPAPNEVRRLRILEVSAQAGASDLATDLAPGSRDSALLFGHARIGADQVAAGGFANLSLYADTIAFDGDVRLAVPQSLKLSGNLVAKNGNERVDLAAPYVTFGAVSNVAVSGAFEPRPGSIIGKIGAGLGTEPSSEPTKSGTAQLTITADLVDLAAKSEPLNIAVTQTDGVAPVVTNIAGFDRINVVSRGDIRLVGDSYGSHTLELDAAQIYPVSNAKVILAATDLVRFGRTTADTPPVPFSAFGTMTVFATAIQQGGVLRAPLGTIALGGASQSGVPDTQRLDLLPGSITSSSGAGLTMPYGGTVDGIVYRYDGAEVGAAYNGVDGFGRLTGGIRLSGPAVSVAAGALVDLSGGGDLRGSGFISGRGGSVDALLNPLRAANPGNSYSSLSSQVFAIVPSSTAEYAPVVPASQGSTPMIGQRITIGGGVPDLAAGTYTLMPASFALLPGAFRVEIGASNPSNLAGASSLGSATAIGNGSWTAAGYLGIANTSIRASLPNQVIITPGAVVRSYSQYNEQGYASFMLAAAARNGQPRPSLPVDAGVLQLVLASDASAARTALSFAGQALFTPGNGGYGGTVSVDVDYYAPWDQPKQVEILGADAAPTAGFVSVRAADLNAIGAARLSIGGGQQLILDLGSVRTTSSTNSVVVRSGAVLRAPDVFIAAGAGGIRIEDGARIDTIGAGASIVMPPADGFAYTASGNMIVVSNGRIDVQQMQGGYTLGGITIGAATIATEGTLGFAVERGTLSIADNTRFGARYLSLTTPSLNIGDEGAIAAARAAGVLPAGLVLNQTVLGRLLAGNAVAGAPKLEGLVLSALASVNFYGAVNLSTIDSAAGHSSLRSLILNTPAIYGLGSAAESATLTTGNLIWNGVSDGVRRATNATPRSVPPGAVIAGGAGTGHGTFNIVADQVLFGYADGTQPDSQLTLDRLMLGFSTVNITAHTQITANNRNTMSVYESQGAYQPGVGYAYSGGNLNMMTPLLTGGSGSVNRITAGGALRVAGSGDVATAPATTFGAEIGLKAATVAIASSVLLPSGKFTVSAGGDIILTDAARLDLAGRSETLIDAVRYSWGGDVSLESAHGNITQAAGSTIDLSAVNNRAGTLSVTALDAAAGHVDLAGTISAGSSGHFDAGGTKVPFSAGGIDVRAQTLDDFAALNRRLTASGVVGSRNFQIKQGDLIVGDELVANSVSLSVDGGKLIVNGRIDASGEQVGTIRLAARDGLLLGSGAALDAHGNVLRVDSYGKPIDAPNRAVVELTTTQGRLQLTPGATIDVRSADAVARGTVELNAPRLGGAGGSGDGANDVAIDATGPVTITGARSVAVNGFRTYRPADGIVNQALMDTVHTSSTSFIAAALQNADLQGRLAGLRVYADAFHLRPGVEIASAAPNGDLTVPGDIDLSRYRYDSLNQNTLKTGVYGSGEPGRLVIRAGGNLNIFGNVSDGFGAAPQPLGTGVQVARMLYSGTQPSGSDVVIPRDGVVLADGTVFPRFSVLNYDLPVRQFSLGANNVLPADAPLKTALTVPAGTVLRADVRNAGGAVIYAKGTLLPQNTVLPVGTVLGAGSLFTSAITIGPMVWPKNVALPLVLTLNGALTLPVGAVVPAATTVKLPGGASSVRLRDSAPTDGIWAAAPMLPAGSQSWSLRLAAGADIAAADSRALRPRSANAGNLVLADSSVVVSGTQMQFPLTSVVRTGTGDLELLSAADLKVRTAYGIYTAGAQSQAMLAPDGSNPYDLPRGQLAGGSILGSYGPAYEGLVDGSATSVYHAWYPDGGGNLLVTAQGNLTGMSINQGNNRPLQYNDPSNWLWRQGGDIAGQRTAWWINFGTLALPKSRYSDDVMPALTGFSGFGTLGGGNVTVQAGGDAGLLASQGSNQASSSTALDIAVGSTGRIGSDGQLVLTGGGDMLVKIGGQLNPWQTMLTASRTRSDSSGALVNVRGLIDVRAGTIGGVNLSYGMKLGADPRWPDLSVANKGIGFGGPVVVPGDSVVNLSARGDLVLSGATDPGRLLLPSTTSYVAAGSGHQGGGRTWFSLWRDETAINLVSAGGNLVPTMQYVLAESGSLDATTDSMFVYPPTLTALATSGSIYYGAYDIQPTNTPPQLVLAPSPQGQLELLAGRSIYANGYAIDISGADQSALATPFRPAFSGWQRGESNRTTNTNGSGTVPNNFGIITPVGNELFAFGPNTASDLHQNDGTSALIYAAGGDIVGFKSGEVLDFTAGGERASSRTLSAWYVAAKPMRIMAARDIVNLGTPVGGYDLATFDGAYATSNLILHAGNNDFSVVSAGRDILYANVQIVGPGTLDVLAGRNIYQADKGSITSIGAVVPGDNRPGASIFMQAGVGASGPDYAKLASLYLDPANLAVTGTPLADQPGKVAKTYEKELAAWLKERYGFEAASVDERRAYFDALASDQKNIFLRTIYFAELREGGREYNNPESSRYGSYLRGRNVIAALFPDKDANGNLIVRTGDITMFGGSNIRTLAGGDIQLLAPGGQIVLGVDGVVPPASAGLITQGAGNILSYSKGSLLLGLSRIMTTYGGSILAWSAEGDINAGRGAKTTIVYTPPKRVTDNYGNVTLSPQAPSSGAGIATLSPIPGIAAGDIDLIAPLGTIDAGEAGVRSSGNVNLAALHIVNAANIQAQGNTTGVPQIQAPNIGGLTEASNASGAAAKQATNPAQSGASEQPSVIIVEVIGFGGGDGENTPSEEERRRRARGQQQGSYNPNSAFQVVGAGHLTEEQKQQLSETERRALRGSP